MTKFGWRHFAGKDANWWDPPVPDTFQRSQLDSVRDVLEEIQPGRVLELGVGRGRATAWLRGSWDYVGIEVNRSLLDVARRSGVEPIAVGTGTFLPFRDDAFGAVVAYDVLMHIWDRNRLFNECSRVLGSDGVLIMNYLRRFSPGWRRYVLAWILHPRLTFRSRDRRFDRTRSVIGSISRRGFHPTILMRDTSSPILLARKGASAGRSKR